MPYYLKWPASTGNFSTNTALLEISGISGTMTNITLTVKENGTAYASSVARTFYDARRQVGSTTSGGDVSYILQFGGSGTIQSDNTSGHAIDAVSVSAADMVNTFLADDVLSFNTNIAPSGGCIAIGAEYNATKHFYGLTISEITITDGAGAHTIDMSSSNGTGTSVTSGDAALTATLYGAAWPGDNSQWVEYGGASSPSISLSGVYAPSQVITVTTTNFVGTPTQATLTDSAANSMVRVLTPAGNDYTFTLPDLPGAGNNTAGLLFGDVTVTIDDPGV